jgi:hypothetical protein
VPGAGEREEGSWGRETSVEKKKKMRERRVSDTWVPHVGSWDEEEI